MSFLKGAAAGAFVAVAGYIGADISNVNGLPPITSKIVAGCNIQTDDGISSIAVRMNNYAISKDFEAIVATPGNEKLSVQKIAKTIGFQRLSPDAQEIVDTIRSACQKTSSKELKV